MRFCDIGGRTYFLERLLPIVADDGYEIEVKDLENPDFAFDKVTQTDYDLLHGPALLQNPQY